MLMPWPWPTLIVGCCRIDRLEAGGAAVDVSLLTVSTTSLMRTCCCEGESVRSSSLEVLAASVLVASTPTGNPTPVMFLGCFALWLIGLSFVVGRSA
jgi:hypothetical protein